MTSDEAVMMITDYVRDTGKPATAAVKDLWDRLQPITDGLEDLVQFALAARVQYEYKRPREEQLVRQPGNRITVRYHRHHTREYVVSVQLLHDVRYNINGRVKSIASCNRHDVLTLARGANAAEQGFARYRQMWEYVAQRLQELKKDHIEDMGHGEQQKIARMLRDCQSFQFPKDLPSRNQKALS